MTDSDSPSLLLAAFRGPVACRPGANAVTLTGAAADSGDDILIVTFVGSKASDFPESLAAVTVRAVDERHYRIVTESRNWIVEANSLHVHRDVGSAFYRAIPPRPAPLKKLLFWRVVLALAGTHAGKRLLLSLRRQA